jgi:rhodanese-related sulfurtransferase
MSTGKFPGVSEAVPKAVWDVLENDESTVLVDVRTKAEWAFVGKPDLSTLDKEVLCIEWSEYPDMSVNPNFVATLMENLVGCKPTSVFFLCRSGVRSLSAAKAVSQALVDTEFSFDCVNILEGFEGDMNAEKKRGSHNGWKARGLPWGQS